MSLGKYFKDFRRREVRLEDLRHLAESDLTEVGLMGAWFVACGETGCAAANEGGLHKATQGCAQGVVFASPQSLYRRSRLAPAKTTYNRVGVQRSTACLAYWVGSRGADCIPLSVASGRPTQSSIWWACCMEAHPAASKMPRRRRPLRTPYCFCFASPPPLRL